MAKWGILVFIVLILFTAPKSSQTYNSAFESAVVGKVEVSSRPVAATPFAGRYARGATRGDTQAAETPVLIWIEHNGNVSPRDTEPVTLNQKDLEFIPAILAVRKSEKVRILNSDPVYHNVFSLSQVKRFDAGRRPTGEYMDITFEREGVVDVFCDIHSNMHAVIYVVSPHTHSFQSLSGSGDFRLEGLPAGSYTLNVYSPGFNLHRTQVQVAASGSVNLGTITLNN
jgi:plastocyanin